MMTVLLAGASDNPSVLTRKQFLAALSSQLGLWLPKEYAVYLWGKLDANRDGLMSRQEFQEFVSYDPQEISGKVSEVLDAVVASMDTGMTLVQLFGPYVRPVVDEGPFTFKKYVDMTLVLLS